MSCVTDCSFQKYNLIFILDLHKSTITAIGTSQKSGWYANAFAISSCKNAIHALDMPQPAHDIPVMNLMGHVMPIDSIAV